MEKISDWKELTFNSLNEMGINVMKALPNILEGYCDKSDKPTCR